MFLYSNYYFFYVFLFITIIIIIFRSIHLCSVSSPTSSAIRTFFGHTDEVNGVCWSPGGIYLASCSDDSTAKIWSVDKSTNGVGVGVGEGGNGNGNGNGNDGLIHDLRGHTKEIYTVRWTPTGPYSINPDKPLLLCTASFDGTVKVRKIKNIFIYLFICLLIYLFFYFFVHLPIFLFIFLFSLFIYLLY